MTARRQLFVITLVGCLMHAASVATEIGDPAPPIKAEEWIKGAPVDMKAGKGKNIYVVEFWATWCAPCRENIPHLTDLQKKYKDKGVVFVGVSDESPSTVRPFVEGQGDRMGYTVMCDKANDTSRAYMQAFNVMGIPHAFIIEKNGRIAWHGYPGDPAMEKVIDEIIAGTFDMAAVKAAAAAGKQIDKYWELAVKDTNYSKELQKIGDKIIKDAAKDASILNEFAWMVLTDPEIKKRDLTMGLRAAQAAFDASQGQDPLVLDTYARALFLNGKKQEAISYQQRALELCKDNGMRSELQKSLDEYLGAAK